MTRRRKVESLDMPAVPVNFLLAVSDRGLGDYELKALTDVANARDEVIEAIERFGERLALAGIVRWFRSIDREELKRKILNPDDPLDLAKRQIKDGQKSEAELLDDLIPRASLPPGSAHLAASLRYQKRNLSEGKCRYCPKPLDRNSVDMCTGHLTAARLRKKPINAKGAPPGSIGWLHGEGFESQHGRTPGTLQSLAIARKKKSRAVLAELGLPLEGATTARDGAKAALLATMPRSKKDALLAWELFEKAGISDSLEATAKKALLELVSAGLIQRSGGGIKGDPYLYFVGGNAKRELAEGHAIENAGRYLRGGR
jgi:ribosomal protein L34E